MAAPVAKSILEETFSYLEIAPNITDESENQIMQMVQVPDVKSKTIGEAGKILTDLGLKYTTEYLELTNESRVLDQFPAPGVEVQKGSIVDLYLDIKTTNTIMMPYLIGKSKEEVITTLDEMGIQYTLEGQGNAVVQNPLPGEELTLQTKVVIEFK